MHDVVLAFSGGGGVWRRGQLVVRALGAAGEPCHSAGVPGGGFVSPPLAYPSIKFCPRSVALSSPCSLLPPLFPHVLPSLIPPLLSSPSFFSSPLLPSPPPFASIIVSAHPFVAGDCLMHVQQMSRQSGLSI